MFTGPFVGIFDGVFVRYPHYKGFLVRAFFVGHLHDHLRNLSMSFFNFKWATFLDYSEFTVPNSNNQQVNSS